MDERIRVRLFGDCQPTINLIFDGRVGAKHHYWNAARTAAATIAQLRLKNIDVEGDWIPGHSGHKGNDRADAKAKEGLAESLAANRQGTTPSGNTLRPHAMIKGMIKRAVKAFEAACYPLSTKAKRAHQFDEEAPPPKVRQIFKEGKMPRRTEVCIGLLHCGIEVTAATRLRLGMTEGLYEGEQGEVRCTGCGIHSRCHDSTEHRLFQCWKYRKERTELEQKIGLISTGKGKPYAYSMASTIGLVGVKGKDKGETWKALGEFLEQTGLVELFTRAWNQKKIDRREQQLQDEQREQEEESQDTGSSLA